MNVITDDRSLVVSHLRRWGGAASDAILDPSCKIFTSAAFEGFIGYRLDFNVALVYGDPVCSPADLPLLVKAFQDYCSAKKAKIIYFMASETFAKWALNNNVCASFVQAAEETYVDPHNDPREYTGTHGSLVRRKVRHALGEKTIVHEYLQHDPQLEQEIKQCAEAWLKARRGPQLHISNVYLFNDRHGKRWFYAKKDKHIVGVCVLNQLQQQQGWLLNHLMHSPHAPHGTPELLVVTALEALRKEGGHHVTFGLIPAKQCGEIVGLSAFAKWVIRKSFAAFKTFFRLDGHRMFWEKFHPQSKPAYLLFCKKRISVRELLALMRAMHISLN